MAVCKFWARNLPEHFPKEYPFKRIDESFVQVGRFIKYDPIDKSPRFLDPPHKRPKKNRHQRRLESSNAVRGHEKIRTDIERYRARRQVESICHARNRANIRRMRAAQRKNK